MLNLKKYDLIDLSSTKYRVVVNTAFSFRGERSNTGFLNVSGKEKASKIALMVCVWLSVVFKVVFAQTPVTLDQILKEALVNNPEIKMARAQWQAAKMRVPQSSGLPNPTATYNYMGKDLETPLGPQENLYEFEQAVPFPAKLFARRQMARADASAAEAKYKAVERQIIYQISSDYYELYAINASLRAAEEVRGIMQKFESIAQARYASRKSEQGEVTKAQGQLAEALKQILELRQQRDSVEALLHEHHNTPDFMTMEELSEPQIKEVSFSLEQFIEEAQANNLELKQAAALRTKDENAVRLAKLENAPDFSVGFQYTQIGNGTTSDPDDGRDAWMIPVKVTIPLWQNRIGAQIQEAKENLKASEAHLNHAQNMARYEVKNAYYRFFSAKQIVGFYENGFLPQAEAAFKSSQAGYEAGRVNIVDLVDSQRMYLNAKIAYYQARADALKNYAAIELAIGKNLSTETPAVNQGGQE